MNLFSKRTTWVVWIVLLVQYLFMGGYIMGELSKLIADKSDKPECAQILDLQIIGITEQAAYSALDCMGEAGRAAYRAGETREDIIYPISYGIFLAFTIFALASFCFTNKSMNILSALIPIFGMGFDYVENHYLVQLIDQFPNLEAASVSGASFGNQLKWIFAFTSFGLVISYGLIAFAKVVRRK